MPARGTAAVVTLVTIQDGSRCAAAEVSPAGDRGFPLEAKRVEDSC